MGQTFVLMLREGLEASLVIGILLAYLVAIDRKDKSRSIWLGVGAAAGVSTIVGAFLFFTAGEFEGKAAKIFEGIASVTAVGVLTWMVFWMRRNAMNIKKSLQAKVNEALRSPGHFGLAAIAFIVIAREGIETALFLFATVRQVGVGAGTVGATLGLVLAAVLGVGIFKGGIRLNLKIFFTATGGFLLVVAAGLLAHGAHELIEAGIVPAGVRSLWDLSAFLPDHVGPGAILKGLIGYNARPDLTEFSLWLIYLAVAGIIFFSPFVRLRRSRVASRGA